MRSIATRKNHFVVMAFVCLLLQGCFPATPGRGMKVLTSEAQAETIPAPLNKAISNNYGMDGVRSACKKLSGAFFSEKSLECFCPYDKGASPLVFTMANGGACVPIHFKERLNKKLCTDKTIVDTYFHGWVPDLNKCLEGLAKNYRTNLNVKIAETLPSREVITLARYLDQYLEKIFVKLWHTPEEYFFNSSIEIAVGNIRVDREFIEQVINPPPITERLRYKVIFIEPEIQALLNTLGHPNSELPLIKTPSAEIIERFPVAPFITSVQSQIQDHGLAGITNIGGNCEQYCLVEHRVTETDEFTAVRSRWYLFGVPFRDLVVIENRKTKEPQAYVQLNLSEGISTILFISRIYDSLKDQVVTNVEVYNRLWQKVGGEAIEILKNVSLKLDDAINVPIATPSSFNNVVLCESIDFDSFKKSRIFNSIRRRPAPTSISTGSFLGWIPNPANLISRFVDPLVELQGQTLPILDAPTHGLKVAKTIIHDNEKVGLIPISMNNCLKNYLEWAPNIKKYSKVVNLSGTETIDRKWCENFTFPENFLGHEKPFLWITASGNTGAQNPTLRCPQNLGPQPNLIVVAGYNGQSIWQYSDYGRNYADIAASPNSDLDAGTSYSSARVSATAAKIAGLYPNLTAEEIKASLLLGSDVPFYPLEVRSGGAHNEGLALKVAFEFSQRKTQPLTPEAIFSLLEPHLSKSEILRRLEIWKERKLINDE